MCVCADVQHLSLMAGVEKKEDMKTFLHPLLVPLCLSVWVVVVVVVVGK